MIFERIQGGGKGFGCNFVFFECSDVEDKGDFLRVNQPLVDFLALFQQKVDRRVGQKVDFSVWQEVRKEQL